MPAFLPAAVLAVPSSWMVLPFLLLLLLIAGAPLIAPHFWERFYAQTAIGLGLVTAAYYIIALRNIETLVHSAREYFSFLSLIASLYVVSGGILLRVKGEATPFMNCLYLLAGAILANILGTTGASMLLIRPWIRMNKRRITGFHIVFFIFLISNIGGGLTPIGDPPLFLGFLKGVPFWWVLQHCWQAWLFTTLLLLSVFWVLDRRNFLRAPATVHRHETHDKHWQVDGFINFPLLGIVLVAVLAPFGWREALMLSAAAISWAATPKRVHQTNHFELEPVKEVAWLFAGIFLTMLPALALLESKAGALGLSTSIQFFWCTGALSGVLDNAPTYLAFLTAAFGLSGLNLNTDMPVFLQKEAQLLTSISLGAVFFGAMTYIGNGPNLMVKKIAEQQRVHMPSFLTYVFRYSLPVLLPIFSLVGLLFFSRWRVL